MAGTDEQRRRLVDRAKAYPFDVPEGSYLFTTDGHYQLGRFKLSALYEAEVMVGGRAVPFAEVAGEAFATDLTRPRHAVIACGSNAAPSRLGEKYRGGPAQDVVPTLRIAIDGYAIVHSAKFSAYGSIPATLWPAPGARVHAFVNLLTDEQLATMDGTEGGYKRVGVPANLVRLEDGTRFSRVETYQSDHGALALDGGPIALACVRGQGARLAVMSQSEAQAHAQRLLGVTGPLDDFIYENVTDERLRRRRGGELKERHALSIAATADA